MKANELMIGDRFICSGFHPFKIFSIEFDDPYYRVWGNDGFPVDLRDLEPIPLTEEILKANGFKDYTEIYEYQFEEDGEKYKFYLKKMYNKEGVCDSWGTNIGGVLPSLIFYVHELQHALRLCGLNDLADNFKIK